MQFLDFLKCINNSYGNWLIALITLSSIVISIKATKGAILARITSGLPFLRIQTSKDNGANENESEISFTINPFNISENNLSEAKIIKLHISLVNYGNGPAVDIRFDKFGPIKNNELPKRNIGDIKIKKVYNETVAITMPGNFNGYAIFPKENIKINLGILYHPEHLLNPEIIKDPTSGNPRSFFCLHDKHYWFKIRYQSLADTKVHCLYTRLMPIIEFNGADYKAYVLVINNINK